MSFKTTSSSIDLAIRTGRLTKPIRNFTMEIMFALTHLKYNLGDRWISAGLELVDPVKFGTLT
jgi:hypothetical protein